MSDLIQLLPDNIANQIAAGEVIQRPASVIKELMENAIDANATEIIVNIKDSGKTLIQVIDNGQGMSKADAQLCFERHATSKVRKADDLFALQTKGFRGEALASIAAIAHVNLKTKREADELGTTVTIEGSKIIDTAEDIHPKGSTFDIKNLFYNVPARRNFLKSDNVEFNHIHEEFLRVSLAHPDIRFALYHNDKQLYDLREAVLRKRIVSILGAKTNDRLVPIEVETDIVKIHGFVVKPEFAKKSRGDQYFFVNNRFFKSSYFNHSVTKAFEGLLKDRAFPGYFLYFEIDPGKIDVNVHPTKTEIKFEEEKYIYSILLSSIRQALGKYNIAPSLDFERETSFDVPEEVKKQPISEPEIKVNKDFNPFSSGASSGGNKQKSFTGAINKEGFGDIQPKKEDWANFYSIEEESEAEQSSLDLESELNSGANYLFKEPYLFVPSKSGIMVIHTSRAIERIVYDQSINSFVSSPIPSQKLLFPMSLEVSVQDANAWSDNMSILRQVGFDGTCENGELELSAAPAVVEEENIVGTVERVLMTIAHSEIDKGEIAHELILSISVAASLKKIDLRGKESQEQLINDLFQCEDHSFSPRKKKIITTITSDELIKKFE